MSRSNEDSLRRLQELAILQEHYHSFEIFLEAAMHHIGFSLTDTQREIAEYIDKGPRSLMVQAQRNIAKSTLAAMYVPYLWIHNPDLRILVVTATQKLASDISTLIIRLVMSMDELECLRPDPKKGDRTSVENFDIHYSLRKPAEKTASLSCVGISGNITGSRSDLLIADDIEHPKNSKTFATREQLLQWSKEFSHVCDNGRIIYLGTPQSTDSIYNSLPSRGFTVRIWPGRYPTVEQLPYYGDHLAPKILERLTKNPELQIGGGMLQDQGQPTDTRIDELTLQRKELESSTPDFQLQYMLNTSLTDKFRYPLKTTQLICINNNSSTLYPMKLNRDPRDSALKTYQVNGYTFKMSSHMDLTTVGLNGMDKDPEYAELQMKVMYIDPAGGGITTQDETAYAVVGFLNGNLYVLSVGGVPGGYEKEKLEKLAEIASIYNPNEVIIEKNMGYGAFKEVFTPILREKFKGGIRDDFVTGQKEKRIADILGPIMGRGSLAIMSSCLEDDRSTSENHPLDKRKLYSLFFQMDKLTLDRNSLIHDDRLDALSGACKAFINLMAIDQKKHIEQQQKREFEEWVKNPLGRRTYDPPQKRGSLFNKYRK